MSSTFTPNLNLELPARNDYKNTWDTPLNANLTAIDSAVGGTSSISLANLTSATYNLTEAQSLAANIVFTGQITQAILVNLPADRGGIFSMLNGTTGQQIINVQVSSGGAAVTLYPGVRTLVVSDGTNVFLATQGLPPGSIMAFLGPTIPGGFITAYGQVLSQANYAGIFAAYGTTFNTGGEGAGNFRMPDLRGVTLAGLDNLGGSARGILTSVGTNGQTLGAFGGEQAHTLSVAELAQHNHATNENPHSHSASQDAHSHNVSTNAQLMAYGGGFNFHGSGSIQNQGGTVTLGNAQPNVYVNPASTGLTIQNAGSNTAHNNVQPTVLVNWIVKT